MPAVTHTNTPFASNVFVNGGPTLGGDVADILGLDDTVGLSDAEARSIIEGIAAEQAVGNDPYINEAFEGREINPNTGQPAGAEPGSDAATGSDASEDNDTERPTSEWINPTAKCNPRVLPHVWTKLETFAKSLGRPIVMNSGYRSPAYNKTLNGSASKSLHMQRIAADVLWGTSSVQGRVDMIQRAVDAGFTGIGCYEDFIHVDTGTKRSWGSTNNSYTSMYEQYKPVLKANGFPNY
tara:strand:+ start:29 stop:742 length:714 start_codon:yes stop_codon:yes gene_type:complete